MNKQIADAQIKMDRKHIKGCTATLVILRMQMQTILWYYLKLPDEQKLITLVILSLGKEEEGWEPLYPK